jgi:hypothetical protein
LESVTYHFAFPDGQRESLRLDAASGVDDDALPSWTELGFNQCPNCPLSASTTKRCPMAVKFVPLVDLFGRLRSHDDVTAKFVSEERTVTKRTTLQRALRSLMGLLAASSDCPRVNFLKPMAHFHLPFSSEKETVYRVVSSYLLGQYFQKQKGWEFDFGLEGLKANYAELQHVNAAMATRMRTIKMEDSTINALALLDLFAQTLSYSIDEALEELRPAFDDQNYPAAE